MMGKCGTPQFRAPEVETGGANMLSVAGYGDDLFGFVECFGAVCWFLIFCFRIWTYIIAR